MREFIAIADENTHNGKETGYTLLPFENTADNLVCYLKKKYKLSDKMFEEVLRDNEVDSLDPQGGELSIKHYEISWTKKQAEQESGSGNYVDVFYLSDEHSESRLLPLEGMPQLFISYILRTTNVSEKVLMRFLHKSYRLNEALKLPQSGDVDIDGNWFCWTTATVLCK